MRKNRKLLGVFLIILALIIMQLPRSEADAASASDFKVNGTTLVGYTGTSQSVTVTDSVDTIGETAFENNLNIRRVTLPGSVKKIEAYAFWGCDNLESVTLGKGLNAVDDYAFANCKGLKTMSIPPNIRSIGIYAFEDCVNLTSITIPPEVTNIHETAFDGCPHVVIKCEPGSYADKFAQELYERQKEMPEYEDVPDYQPDTNVTVDTVPTPAPTKDPSVYVEINTGDAAGDVLGFSHVFSNQAVVFIENADSEVLTGAPAPTVTPAPVNAAVAEKIESSSYPKYTIVDGKIVADQAYYRNLNLTDVTIPAGVEEVGEFSYARSSLASVNIPEGTGKIGYGAFYHCDNLNSVTLPSTLSCVEPKAFKFSAWVDNFLAGTTGEGDFLISGNTLVAYRGNSSEVRVPEGVSLIAGEVFMGHGEIESVVLPESLRVVGEGAFETCGNLKSVQFGESVEGIKDRAFYGCNVNSVILPASVETLGLDAFDTDVELKYLGNEPARTHEMSAERLSNENYRKPGDNNEMPGVTVSGIEGTSARLEGAVRNYVLSINEVTSPEIMKNAYMNSLGTEFPADGIMYDMHLTDSSNICITKLGRQKLTVMMPLPEKYSGKNVVVVTVDRNGQLESVVSERVSLDGKDCVRFSTTHPSTFGIYPNGTVLSSDNVIEETTVLASLSDAPDNGENFWDRINLYWILSGLLFCVGVACIFYTTKYI